MSDDTPPPPPDGGATPGPGDGGSHGGGAAATSTGLDPNVSGLLAYVLWIVTGVLFYVLEKKHREVRFHAAQSLLIGIVAVVVSIALAILTAIPVLGWIFGVILYPLVGLGFFILWIVLLIKGYNLEHFKLPVIGDMAEEWAEKGLETT